MPKYIWLGSFSQKQRPLKEDDIVAVGYDAAATTDVAGGIMWLRRCVDISACRWSSVAGDTYLRRIPRQRVVVYVSRAP